MIVADLELTHFTYFRIPTGENLEKYVREIKIGPQIKVKVKTDPETNLHKRKKRANLWEILGIMANLFILKYYRSVMPS